MGQVINLSFLGLFHTPQQYNEIEIDDSQQLSIFYNLILKETK